MGPLITPAHREKARLAGPGTRGGRAGSRAAKLRRPELSKGDYFDSAVFAGRGQRDARRARGDLRAGSCPVIPFDGEEEASESRQREPLQALEDRSTQRPGARCGWRGRSRRASSPVNSGRSVFPSRRPWASGGGLARAEPLGARALHGDEDRVLFRRSKDGQGGRTPDARGASRRDRTRRRSETVLVCGARLGTAA